MTFFLESIVRQFSQASNREDPVPATGNNQERAGSAARSRASTLDSQSVQQSHATLVSTSPHDVPSLPDSTAAPAANYSHLKSYFSSDNATDNISPPERQPAFSLGQTLFDRFAPLVATRFSPFSTYKEQHDIPITHTIQPQSPVPSITITGDGSLDPDNREPVVIDAEESSACCDDLESSHIYTNMDASNNDGSARSDLDPSVQEVIERDIAMAFRSRIPRSEARIRRERELRALGQRPFEYGDEESRAKQHELLVSREGDLRRKIQDICQLPLNAEEKARRIHLIMNEQYIMHQQNRKRAQSQVNLEISTLDRPNSSSSFNTISSSGSATDLDLYKKFNINPDDLVPTYRRRRASSGTQTPTHPLRDNMGMTQLTTTSSPEAEETPAEDEVEYGCEHYKRNVKIQCFDCKTWWNCRNCHDDANLGHSLPRHKTENMLCMLCQTPGPAGQYCQHCGEQSAYYFCETCKLWDDDATKRIYHCDDCGICRLGEGIGKDFQHCNRCNVDIPIQQFPSHKCVERATDCDCPICGDYMFNSTSSVVSLPCGHYLHHACYTEYARESYKCPVCKKSIRNMQSEWRKMEAAIEDQPMPENLRNISVDVRCNDCAGKSRTPFHWLGNKCDLCDSFNTVEIEVHREPATGLSPSPPRGNWRNPRGRTIPHLRARSYFQDEEHEDPDARPEFMGDAILGLSNLGLSNTAYEMLAAMSRNLSPIRRYLNAGDNSARPDAGIGPATEAELEQMGFWNAGPENANNDEDDWEDDEEDDDDDDDSDSTDTEFLFDDDDSDSDDESSFEVQLTGHR
ncbi:hypothetical protein BT63DRAFT_131459 [Microthyrium microscopicum]|uniref:Zf-CHY-domain-containing protein n=1 Tax=Microthyrium microscopicum TaxID=703497 RepID=A0A6A6ULD5_9PEZI|nr:hypothetical protein BT63DRAFT_131459 [Microthyrium microscopicum]